MLPVLSLLSMLSVLSQESSKPAVRIVPCRPVRLLVTNDLDTEVSIAGVSQQSLRIGVEWELELEHVGKTESGSLEFDVHIVHTCGEIQAPLGGSIPFDSDEEEGVNPGLTNLDPLVQQMRMLAGHTVKVFVTPTGRVESVRGYAAIFEGKPIEKVLKAIGDPLTDEGFLPEMQALFAHLPEADDVEASSWVTSYPYRVFSDPIDFSPRIQVVESNADTLRLRFGTVARDDTGDQEVGTSPAAFTSKADVRSASLRGESVVSREDGLVLRNALEFVVEVGMPNPATGGSLPTVVKQRIEVRREKALPPAEAPPGRSSGRQAGNGDR